MITSNRSVQIDLPDLPATDHLAANLGKHLVAGLIIYLNGDLGVGKTTFVGDLLQSLGHKGSTKSPTYTLVEGYLLNKWNIYHFDLYRLNSAEELEHIGIRDYLLPEAICIFEWANKGLGVIPAADIEINFTFNQDGRIAQLNANSEIGLEVLQSMAIGL